MTQEDKELLFKDICARLPYGVKVRVKNNEREREWYGVSGYDTTVTADSISKLVGSNFKPYLRPMSNMTEEEKDTYNRMVMCNSSWVVDDWLNNKKFDYRGLIEKGLALEAREGMYNETDTEKI